MRGYILCDDLFMSEREDCLESYFNHINRTAPLTTLVVYAMNKMTLYDTNLFRNFIKQNAGIDKFIIFAPSFTDTAREDILKIINETQTGKLIPVNVCVYEQPELNLDRNIG